MRRRAAIPVLIALLALSGVAVSRAEVEQSGNLRVHFDADFVPHSLPRQRPAPVAVQIHGSIATTDGSHPPALRWLEVELNRNGHLSARGLPVCSGAQLQSTTTRQALARCAPALIGRGNFQAAVNLGGEVAASGRILAFNSRRHGHHALLLHFFASVPIRFTLVVPLTIGHQSKGQFGTVLRAQIPRLGGGIASITQIDLSIGRRYSFAGARRSYVSAACSAPAGFSFAGFSFARANLRFESHPPIEALLRRTCQVR
jgi:hypothetical protein